MVTKFSGIDPDKVDLAAMLGSHGLEGIDVVLAFLFVGINKEVRQRSATGDINFIRVTVDLTKDGDSQLFQPVLKVLYLGRGYRVGKFSCGFVEGAVNNNGWRRDQWL